MRRTTEEYEVDGGGLTVLYLEDAEGNVLRYRYAFTRADWSPDEWIRLDHRQQEPSHVHLRRRTPVLRYAKDRVLKIVQQLINLSDAAANICGGGAP